MSSLCHVHIHISACLPFCRLYKMPYHGHLCLICTSRETTSLPQQDEEGRPGKQPPATVAKLAPQTTPSVSRFAHEQRRYATVVSTKSSSPAVIRHRSFLSLQSTESFTHLGYSRVGLTTTDTHNKHLSHLFSIFKPTAVVTQ